MGSFNGRLGARVLTRDFKLSAIANALLRVVAAAICTVSVASADEDYLPPKIQTSTPTGVSLTDGSFIYSNTDISIGPLTLERFHLGGVKDASAPAFGVHMSHNFDIYVAQNVHHPSPPGPPGDRYIPVVHLGQGAAAGFLQDFINPNSVSQWTPDSLSATLTYGSVATGDYQYIAQDGTTYTFTHTVNASPPYSQRIASIVYRGGRTLTFTYNSSDKLRIVNDNSGYALVFDYGSNGLVSAACGFNLAVTYVSTSTTCSGASLRTSYGYDGSNRLTSVTDVMGQVTTFAYSAHDEISCITPPTHGSCRFAMVYGTTFGAYHQVTQQTLADSTVWQFSSSVDPTRHQDLTIQEEGQQGSVVTDPLSHTAQYQFTGSSPYRFTDTLGRITDYVYSTNYDPNSAYDPDPPPGPPYELHDGHLLLRATFPEGNTYEAGYGSPFDVLTSETFTPKPGSSESAAVISYTYPSGACANRLTCTQPLTRTDPRGAVTNFDYFSSGLIHYQMDPSPAPASYASRPLHLYTYVQRYAYIKNSGGTLVAASSPIWVKDTETQCQTVAGSSTYNTATCDPSGPQVVTTYNYPANGATHTNLLPSSTTVSGGATAITTTTTYTDAGDVASVDGPRTDVSDITYTVYDNMRRKVWEVGADTGGSTGNHRVIVHHVYSEDGNETATETGHGDSTSGATGFAVSQYSHMTYDGMGRLIRTETGTP